MSTIGGLNREPAAGSNDPRLMRLRAAAAEEREGEIGKLIFSVRPLAKRVIYRHVKSERLVRPEDAEDILSTVSLRLVAKLRAIAGCYEEPIDRFDDYVAAVTYNVLSDHMRQRYPQRTRLNNRLRYAFAHDARLAMWTTAERRNVCGLTPWRDGSMTVRQTVSLPAVLRTALLDRDRPAEALVALFRGVGAPVAYDALLDELSAVGNADVRAADLLASETPAVELLESRERLDLLWRELRELRPMQRKALLLNLRDARTHALSLFLLAGVASAAQIAEALEMTQRDLSEIWNELPFDDLRIASMLQTTRQQVINLRKCARERLARRLAR